MRTFEELERLWLALPPLRQETGRVELLVVRKGNEIHETPQSVELSPDFGVIGDRWSIATDKPRDPERQVTLMMVQAARLVAADLRPLHLPGDNFLVDFDLSEEALPTGTRCAIGDAELEVSTKPHTGCNKFVQRFGQEALRWLNWRDHRSRRLRGINCRVVKAGHVSLGAQIRRL